MALRDVSYVSMITIMDPLRMLSSDSIGWVSAPLHDGLLVRVDSIGLPNQVRFGVDAEETWIISDGEPIESPNQLTMARFDMIASRYWFSLPFRLAEEATDLEYVGAERGDEGERWEKLKATYPKGDTSVPGKWFTLYINSETGLIDRVHCQLEAPFLNHDLWVGEWRHYQDWDGIRKERLRQFFPADEDGRPLGGLVAEQYVEHVRFNSGYSAQHFDKPAAAEPGAAPPKRAPAGPADRVRPDDRQRPREGFVPTGFRAPGSAWREPVP